MIWVEERRNCGEKREKRGAEDFSTRITTANIKCCYQKATANYTDYKVKAKAP